MAKNDTVDINADIRIMNRGLRKGSVTRAEYDARTANLEDVSAKGEALDLAPLMKSAMEATARRREKALQEEPSATHRIPTPSATYEDEAYGFAARVDGEEAT